MTLRELLERERDRAAEEHSERSNQNDPHLNSLVKRSRRLGSIDGFNHALELLWPCVKALEKYRGQASRQQKGPTFYSEADEALAEIQRRLRKEMTR